MTAEVTAKKVILKNEQGEYLLPYNNILEANLTNFVLHAPNGVFSVGADGLTITVKQGLTTLMPDGRDENNNLKNIKHVVEEEFSFALQNLDINYGRYILALDTNNNLGYGSYCDMDFIPTTYRGTWIRHIVSNDIYQWDEETNSYVKKPIPIAILGRVIISERKIISSGAFYPSSLLKDSDIPSLSNISMPSDQIVTLILGANGTRYISRQNGYIHLAGMSTTAQCALELSNQTSGYHDYSPGAYAQSFVTANIPVVVGDVFVTNVVNVTPQFFQINYACGVV